MNKTLSGRLLVKKTKKRSCWVIPKVAAVAYESVSSKSQLKQGFTKVVVTRAGRLQEWWQGELRLYFYYYYIHIHSWIHPSKRQSSWLALSMGSTFCHRTPKLYRAVRIYANVYNLFVFRLHHSITLRRKAQDGRSILFCSRNIQVVPKEIFPVHCLAFYPYNAIGYLVLCVQCSCHYSIV